MSAGFGVVDGETPPTGGVTVSTIRFKLWAEQNAETYKPALEG